MHRIARRSLVALAVPLALFGAGCGGGGGSGRGDVNGGGGGAGGDAGETLVVSSAPAWDEPAPPSREEVEAAIARAEQAALAAVGPDDAARLDADAAELKPGAAGFRLLGLGYAADFRLDAARYLAARASGMDEEPAARATLSALLGFSEDDEDAALLARSALDRLGAFDGTASSDTVRVRASAWNNLGHARRRLGEAAGAIHAYEQAVALVPSDPTYRTGLAASYADAGLLWMAAMHASAAEGLEEGADPTLEDDEERVTEARAWARHIGAAVEQASNEAPPWAGQGPSDGLPGEQFGALESPPPIGSRMAGFSVIQHHAGGVVVSAPPLSARGNQEIRVGLMDCEQDAEDNFFVNCPAGEANSGGSDLGWPGMAVTASVVQEPDTTCGNLWERLLTPEIAPLVLQGETLEDLYGDLSGQFVKAFYRAQESFAGGFFLTVRTAEWCTEWDPHYQTFHELEDRVSRGCDCFCDDAGCPACWAEVAAACNQIFQIESRIGVLDNATAHDLDPAWSANWRAGFEIMPAIAGQGDPSRCTGFCLSMLSSTFLMGATFSGAVPSMVGGRMPQELYENIHEPTRKYAECLARIPSPCGGTGGTPNGDDPAKSPCLCPGLGIVKFCLLADGTVELTLSAVFQVGVRTNLRADGPTLRIGVGLGQDLTFGAWTLGSVGFMTWWDANTDTWGPALPDFSVGLEGYDGMSVPFGSCDSWSESGPAPEADDRLSALEISAGFPGD